MDFVSNIWKKAPFKSESVEPPAEAQDGEASLDTQTEPVSNAEESNNGNFNIAENITGQVTGGVNYVSNIFKSTFKSDSSENKEAKEFGENIEESNENKKDSITAGATNFMSNVWGKSTSLFKTEDSESKRKASQVSETEIKEDEGSEEAQKSPTENVSQKALDSAKTLGNFVFNMANKAGQTVSATAKHIKKTVESTSLLADFTKEQQEFIKEHGGNIQIGEPPWVGCEDEEEIKKQILSLSQDKRSFVRSPPSGVQFEFDLQHILPVALTLLKEDENLNKMRFEIVPSCNVNEESFWRNYFYRVSLIKQSNFLSSMNKNSKGWHSSSSESEGPDNISPTNPEAEFVSDYIQNTVADDELASGLRKAAVSKAENSKDDKQWEDELTKDLQEFEMVNDIDSALYAELEKELSNT